MTRNPVASLTNSLPSATIRLGMVLGIGLASLACNLLIPDRATSAPVGRYDCYGHEAGLLAYTGTLDIRADGSVEFLSRTGHWDYDPETEALLFGGDTLLARAEYHADHERLSVALRPGVEVAHAERGTMSCELRQE